jgi:hypothetical protein
MASRADRITIATVFACIAFLSLFVTKWANHPRYGEDADRIFYVAVALSQSGLPLEKVHDQTYELFRQTVAPDDYTLLTQSSKYREELAHDPGIFGAQFRFYQPRLLWTSLIRLYKATGLSLLSAIAWTNAIATAGSILLLSLWTGYRTNVAVGASSCVILAFQSSTDAIARLGTPDAVTTIFLVAGLFLLFDRKSLPLASLQFALAILTRTDSAVLILIALVYSGIAKQTSVRSVVTGIAAAIALAVLVDRTQNAYPLATVLHHTFIGRLLHPETTPALWSLDDHREAMRQGLITLFSNRDRAIAGAFGCLSAWFLARKSPNSSLTLLSVSCLTALPIRFLLFPIGQPRNHALWHYSGILSILIALWVVTTPTASKRQNSISVVT